MRAGDERYERLKHQTRFLYARRCLSREMEAAKRQLWLLERLSGKDESALDPQLVDRIHRELEHASLEQLRTEGLVEERLESWEPRSENPTTPMPVPTKKSSVAALPAERAAGAYAVSEPTLTTSTGELAALEGAMDRFLSAVASLREAYET